MRERADSRKEHMGLTTWSGAPDGKILLRDAKVAKNYLTQKELKTLNRVVSMYLDYAEDWAERLDKFLEFYEYAILKGKGKISRKEVDDFVKLEYEKFRQVQDKLFKSDYNKFDEETKKFLV